MHPTILNPKDNDVLDPNCPNPLAADLEEDDEGLLPALPVTVLMAPPLPVGSAPLGILLGAICWTFNVVGLDTTVADGT
jgi:hypothetical protein